MDLTGLLDWLTGADGGAFILVSWAVSWGLKDVAAWQKLSAQTKILIVVIVSGLLGAGAAALRANPELVDAITPYFQPVIYAVMAWLTTQTAHRASKHLDAKLVEAKAATVEAVAQTAQAKAQTEQAEVLAEQVGG